MGFEVGFFFVLFDVEAVGFAKYFPVQIAQCVPWHVLTVFGEFDGEAVIGALMQASDKSFDDQAGDQVQAREPGDDFGFEIFPVHPYKPAARMIQPTTAPPTTSHTAPTPRHNIRMDAMPAIAILGIESRVR